ncbi:MAG: RNA polymerase sigma factor [Gammaproteobacteria bacterium]
MIDTVNKTQQKQDNQQSKEMIDATQAEEMVRNNISWMIVIAQRLLTDRALAEDAVQEAFVAAFRSYHKFENRSSLKTWLHRITVNAALMKLRKIKRLKEQAIDEFLPEYDQHECRIEAPWNHISSIEDIVENEQFRAQVHIAINKLPDAYRNVLLLRDIEGYDTGEVAELLDLSESNVKVRLHRARAALKKLIEPLLRDEEH